MNAERVLVPREPTYQMAEAMGVKWEAGDGFPARYRAMLAAAPTRPAVEAMNTDKRERDRKRFSDPAFNRWLDEGVSDEGHTIYDYIGGDQYVPAAWAGWDARATYEAPTLPAVDDALADSLRAQLAAAEAERDRAVKDAERLDWLGQGERQCYVGMDGRFTVQDGEALWGGDTLRAAIDAAIASAAGEAASG